MENIAEFMTIPVDSLNHDFFYTNELSIVIITNKKNVGINALLSMCAFVFDKHWIIRCKSHLLLNAFTK